MLADELDIIGYEVVLEPEDDTAFSGFNFTVQVPSDVNSVTVPFQYLGSLDPDTPLKVEVGAIERRHFYVDAMMLKSFGNTTFTEEDGFCNNADQELCPEEEEEEEKLAAVALTPSVGSVGSGGAGAISGLMLAIGSALGLLGWMRRRKAA